MGLAGVSPGWGEAAAHEAERCAQAGLKGVGELHPDTQGFDLGQVNTMAPLMEVVRERGLILTTHASEPVGHAYAGKGVTRPEVLWRFLQSFADVYLGGRAHSNTHSHAGNLRPVETNGEHKHRHWGEDYSSSPRRTGSGDRRALLC